MTKRTKILTCLLLTVIAALSVFLVACGGTKTYTVTYYAGDVGTDVVTGMPEVEKVEKGKTATEPAAPSRSGYDFEGWFTASEGGGEYLFSTPVKADLNLHAHWKAKDTQNPDNPDPDNPPAGEKWQLPEAFFTGENWAQMPDDGGNPVTNNNTGLVFYQNNIGYNVNKTPAEGEEITYSFLVKSEATGAAGWSIRFGANKNDNSGTTYYQLSYAWDAIVLQKSTTGEWLSQSRETTYAVNAWNRFDLTVGKAEGALTIALSVNGEKVNLTESTPLAGISYEDGVMKDSTPHEYGNFFQVKVWNTKFYLASVNQPVSPEKVKDGEPVQLDAYTNAQKEINIADYIDGNGAENVSYEAVSSAPSAVQASVEGNQVKIKALQEGTATVTLTAKRGSDVKVTVTFAVTATDSTPPSYPTKIKDGGNILLNLNGATSRKITVSEYIEENLTQNISYSVTSSDACVSVTQPNAQGEFTITAVSEGTATVNLSVSGGGETVEITFAVTVDDSAAVATKIKDIEDITLNYYATDSKEIDLSEYVEDNGAVVTYEAEADGLAVTAQEQDGVLTVTAVKPDGNASVTVKVLSGGKETFTLEFIVTLTDTKISKTNTFPSLLDNAAWKSILNDGGTNPQYDQFSNSAIIQYGNSYQEIGEQTHISFDLWVNAAGNYGFELWFRSNTNDKNVAGNKYVINGYKNDNGGNIIVKRESGSTLASFPAFPAGEFTRFDIVMFDSDGSTTVRIYLNGVKAAQFTDSAPISGGKYFALKSWGPQVAIRTASELPNPDAIRVAAVGDSITYGHAWHNESYPVYLGEQLGSDYTVGNFGLNGASVTGFGGSTLKYSSQAQYNQSIAYAPDVIVIMLGANDANGWANAQASYESELRALIASYQQACPNAKILLVTSAPTLENNAFGIPNETIKDSVNPIQRSVARDLGLVLVDLREAMENAEGGYNSFFREGDGVHLSVAGAQFTANVIAEAIRQL